MFCYIFGFLWNLQYDSHGGYKYEIDNDVKKSLELLLIVAVMSYKIR